MKRRLNLQRRIKQVRNRIEKEEAAKVSRIVKLKDLVTCILHLENRTTECVIYHVLCAAFDGLSDDEKKAVKALIEKLLNETVFGNGESAGQWTVPYADGEVQKISLTNGEARAICERLPDVMESIHGHIENEVDRDDWRECVNMFTSIMEELRSRENFEDERIRVLQNRIDNFMDKWHRLSGRGGSGNYMHCLDVGHICDQLFLHRNLYRYSQQGWEALNKKAKKIFFTKTAMGGGRSKSGKLLPILELFLRELFWKFGWGDKLFTKHVYPRDEGEKYQSLEIEKCYHQPMFRSSRSKSPKAISDEDLGEVIDSIINFGSDNDLLDMLCDDGEDYLERLRGMDRERFDELATFIENCTAEFVNNQFSGDGGVEV